MSRAGWQAIPPVAIPNSGHIYWTNGNAFPVTISRPNLDGTGVNQSVITLSTRSSVFGVAVDAEP